MDGAGANPGASGGFDPCECIVGNPSPILSLIQAFFFN